jgi:lysophospholipase L1-like esterase
VATVLIIAISHNLVGDEVATSFKKIAIIGSSTAVGTGASDYAHAWAGLYTAYLDSLDSSNVVVNLAVGGYTTYYTLPTGTTNPTNRPAVDPAHNITAALATRPDAVIINLPSNDAVAGYSEAETKTNFLKMAAACQASNVPVWIATTQPRNLSAGARTNLMNVRAWIISTFPARHLDFWTTIANPDGTINAAYNADGVHLNDAGHQILYSRVVEGRIYERVSVPHTFTAQLVSDAINIRFDTVQGINYVVELSQNLADWQMAMDPVVGTGAPASLSIPATNPPSFFRLRLEAFP